MIDYVFIGPTPAGEDCAQLGDENYSHKARQECTRFIELIRQKCGPEPEGACLVIKTERHDFGLYHEVAVKFDDTKEQAIDYAFRVEAEAPKNWE